MRDQIMKSFICFLLVSAIAISIFGCSRASEGEPGVAESPVQSSSPAPSDIQATPSPTIPAGTPEPPTPSVSQIVDEESLLSFLANIKAEDLESDEGSVDRALYLRHLDWGTPDNVVRMLSNAVHNRVEYDDSDSSFGYAPWCIWLTLKAPVSVGSFSSDAVSINAGFNEPIIRIGMGRTYIYCQDEELYWLMRTMDDGEAGGVIDEEMLDKYRPLVDKWMAECLSEYQASDDYNNSCIGNELINFTLMSVFDDLLDGTIYVYNAYFYFIFEDPRLAVPAGSQFLDSQGRLVNSAFNPYLVVLEQKNKIIWTEFMHWSLYGNPGFDPYETAEDYARAEIMEAYLNR